MVTIKHDLEIIGWLSFAILIGIVYTLERTELDLAHRT